MKVLVTWLANACSLSNSTLRVLDPAYSTVCVPSGGAVAERLRLVRCVLKHRLAQRFRLTPIHGLEHRVQPGAWNHLRRLSSPASVKRNQATPARPHWPALGSP